jgi:hypothetical protein
MEARMCGSDEDGIGIITGLIAAAAILVFAFAERYGGAHAGAIVQHSISAPAHVALEMGPLSLDIDLAAARASVDVSL